VKFGGFYQKTTLATRKNLIEEAQFNGHKSCGCQFSTPLSRIFLLEIQHQVLVLTIDSEVCDISHKDVACPS